ncbi:MAG: hypothetical protein AB1512_08875 [Thermodesulfobacteriota bacterium]
MKRGLFYAAWLAVVIGGLILAFGRFRSYGVWGPAAIIMGFGLLTIFVVDHVLSRRGDARIKARIGDLATLFIILAIAVALLVSVVIASLAGKWLAAVVFAIFAFGFARILFEYLAHLKRKSLDIKKEGRSG